jgi:Tfp pilus assembly protein PilF
LGYAHARRGQTEAALGYYKQALALEPEHRGANEYLGELYLKMGDLASAEERLKVLDKACTFGCAEYDLLKAAVKQYKTTGKFTSSKGL